MSLRYLYIVLLGFVGAALRFLLETWAPSEVWTCAFLGGVPFPLTTLLINLLGCFSLPMVYVFLARGTRLDPDVVSGMGVGLVGAFTTLSTFCAEVIGLVTGGFVVAAVCYIAATSVLSLAASWGGYSLSIHLLDRRLHRMTASQGGGDHAA